MVNRSSLRSAVFLARDDLLIVLAQGQDARRSFTGAKKAVEDNGVECMAGTQKGEAEGIAMGAGDP